MAPVTLRCPVNPMLQRAGRAAPGRQARLSVKALVDVRPYTVRKGDTIDSIASKREIRPEDVRNLNHGVDLKKLEAGQTIVIPAGKLSARDKEILEGISSRSYRLYPVRKGEKLVDVITKRGIMRSEVQGLNPGVNLDRLKENQVLQLPANRFTTREKEMLASAGAPTEFFQSTPAAYGIGFLGGLVVAAVVAFVVRKKGTADAAEDP